MAPAMRGKSRDNGAAQAALSRHARAATGLAAAASLLTAGGAAAQAPAPATLAGLGPQSALFGGPFTNASLDCMTAAIAYEAGSQSIEGQEAVGQVILNRVANPNFPKTVCGVVFAGSERRTGCQFSFTCDGSLRRRLSSRTLSLARSVAMTVLSGGAPDHVGGATHYHADYVYPYWAPTGTRSAKIGVHIFYRMPGDGATPFPGAGMTADDQAAASLARAALVTAGTPPATRRPGAMTAASNPMFAPWGLPIGAGPQR